MDLDIPVPRKLWGGVKHIFEKNTVFLKKGVELQTFYNWYWTCSLGLFYFRFCFFELFSNFVKSPEFDFDALFREKAFFFKTCFGNPPSNFGGGIPDPGSGAFLIPWSGMGKKSGSGSYFRELKEQFFGLKYLGSLMWIRDPGWKKVWSGIRDMSKFGIYVQFTIFKQQGPRCRSYLHFAKLHHTEGFTTVM